MPYYNNYCFKKALVVTTVASTLDQFCMDDIGILQKHYKVEVAANFSRGNNTSVKRTNEFKLELVEKNIFINEINFVRNPLSISNFIAYRELKRIIHSGNFDLIHCHTPVASVLTRLAVINCKKTSVIYTAHGFHFFKGASIFNWLIYYPIEKFCAKFTNKLITINREDYAIAKKFQLCNNGKVYYIPGVGIDTKSIEAIKVDKIKKRHELGLPEQATVILSVGELNKNKNHKTFIKALGRINNPNIYYIICGKGELENNFKKLAKDLGIEKQVKILGYRKDVIEINKIADIFAFPSYREGLSVALMEAMACGLPVICSKIRGNTDLIENRRSGFLFNPSDVNEIANCIDEVMKDNSVKVNMGLYNKKRIIQFDINNVRNAMCKIYYE